jgi:hypothetical protein
MLTTRPKRTLGAFTLLLSLVTGVAFAAEAPMFGDYKAKNFLSEYSNIAPEGGESKAYKYRDPAVDFSQYNKLLIDRIQVWIKEDAEHQGIDPIVFKELTDYFHQAISKAVEGAYEVVSEPGPGVLRLRIAVTDLVPNKPAASVVSLVVPFVWLGEAGAGAAEGEAGSTPFVGEATVELEAMDSQTSKQVAAYIETRVGKKYMWSKGITTGISQYTKAYSTWSYTKEAFDFWAKLIRERLDAAR